MPWIVKFTWPANSELVLTLDHVFRCKSEALILADKINKQNEGIKAVVVKQEAQK